MKPTVPVAADAGGRNIRRSGHFGQRRLGVALRCITGRSAGSRAACACHADLLARREGEASLVWVRDFGDADQAACVTRGVDLIVPAAVYREWIASGDAPEQPPQGVRLSGA